MNNDKIGNLLRVVAVILIAVLALFLIGATAHGSFMTPDDENNSEGDDSSDDDNSSTPPPDEDTENNDNTDGENTPPPEVVLPTYTSKLTGLTVTEEEYLRKYYALIYSSGATLYGISSADLVVEIPTDKDETRYLVYLNNPENFGKLGTLSEARDNILALQNTFGGIFVANGTDGAIGYTPSGSLHIDFTLDNKYSYNESVQDTYTSGSLIKDYVADKQIDENSGTITTLPFLFSDEDIVGKASCQVISLPFSDYASTTLVFDKTYAKYKLTFLGKEQTDILSGACASFTNVFVLFANSTTYERSDLVETVIETCSGGSGYYASLGGLTEIRWEADKSGRITFKTLTSEALYINPGNTYVGYFKASCAKDVSFE